MGKLLWIIIIFLIIGGYIIKTNLDADLNDKEDRVSFAKEFWRWLLQLGRSTKNTVGYAIKQDWFPNAEDINSTRIIVVED